MDVPPTRPTSVRGDTWVLAARRRDPGLVAEAAGTLDEISADASTASTEPSVALGVVRRDGCLMLGSA